MEDILKSNDSPLQWKIKIPASHFAEWEQKGVAPSVLFSLSSSWPCPKAGQTLIELRSLDLSVSIQLWHV